MLIPPLLGSVLPVLTPADADLKGHHRQAAHTLVRHGMVQPSVLSTSDDWTGHLCSMRQLFSIRHLEVRTRLTHTDVIIEVHLSSPNNHAPPADLALHSFARQARRMDSSLLGLSLHLLSRLCRFTRPLLTPDTAITWAHVQVHGEWSSLMALEDDLNPRQTRQRLHREGLGTPEDAERWYDNSARAPTLPTLLRNNRDELFAQQLRRFLQQFATRPTSRGEAVCLQRLQTLLNCFTGALPALTLLSSLDNHTSSGLVFVQYAATRTTRHDHLEELYDHLNTLESDSLLHSVTLPLRQGSLLSRVMRAFKDVDQLAQRACTALVQA
ncbi:hypothetical protein [Deinococcus ruber]|uniref:Uncharacterized protein n=1 Tax=Deinococcus ruber TaxID=1848197 RepID=A0A918CCJ0_9DEIO|nr:hypothetical protein [Deinococcus ruber]GGR17309.1 hypothetical protein GCM10008957_32430 [Deinococcus ruber]